MLILMKGDHTKIQIDLVVEHIKKMNLTPHVIPGEHSVAIGITGNKTSLDRKEFLIFEGVKDAIAVTKPFKLTSRDFKSSDSIVSVGDAHFGGDHFVAIAGPCAVESYEQTLRIAQGVKARGAQLLRAGAYKPRTSPYSFQGLGEEGLKILARVREVTGLPVITEAVDLDSLKLVDEYADVIQIGTRNALNYSLLKECGKCKNPVVLKRGFSSTIDEWLLAAEYIIDGGNPNVILCERGLRSFDKHTRNVLDLAAVPLIRSLSHLPIMVDPSHGTGKKELVTPMSLAAVAAGAHSIIVEVHDRPHEALSDGQQALQFTDFEILMDRIYSLRQAIF